MLNEFIAYLEQQVKEGAIYVWGAQGETVTSEAQIKRMETSTANANRAIELWKGRLNAGFKQVKMFDCSGLGMYWLQNIKGLFKSDLNSNDMKGNCTSITKSQLKKGDWVFRLYVSGNNKGKAYHIGYVVDDSLNVIEAKGRDEGVVRRSLNASGAAYWNHFGRPGMFKSEIQPEPTKPVEKPVSPPAAKTYRNLKLTYTVIANKLNLRSGAGTLYKRLGQYKKGDIVTFLGVKGSWLKVRISGQAGYMSAQYLKRNDYMRGDDVKALQSALAALGYATGKADGVYGQQTATAVLAFQEKSRLTPDGIAGENTQKTLKI